MSSSSVMGKLPAQGNSNPIAIHIYRALTAKRRNGLACLAAKSNHDGVINNPVATRQFFPQSEFGLLRCFCFHVAQPVGNPVHMRINTNSVFAVGKRNNKVGGFAANSFDTHYEFKFCYGQVTG